MEEFYYKIGPVETRTPWGRPTFDKVQNLLKDLNNTTDILKRNDVYVWGGILFDYNTWDIDIILSGKYPEYTQLDSDFREIYDRALNKHNVLVDVFWSEEIPKKLSYVEAKQNNFKIKRAISIKYNRTEKIDNRFNKSEKFINELVDENNPKISWGDNKKLTDNLIELTFSDKLPNKFKYNPRYGEYIFKDPIPAKNIISNNQEWFDKNK